MADTALLECIADKQPAACHELFRRHAASVARLARCALSQREDVEDVVQNVFLAAHRYASGFRGDASVRTWLMSITRNEALKWRSKQARHQPELSLEELGAEAGWGSETPEDVALRLERKDALQNALASLPDEDSTIIVLRDLEGLSGEDTAKLLEISLPAMKSRLHRARLGLAIAIRQGAL